MIREVEIPVSLNTFRAIREALSKDLRVAPSGMEQKPIALVFYNGILINGFDVYITRRRDAAKDATAKTGKK